MLRDTKLNRNKNAKLDLTLTPDNLDYPIHIHLLILQLTNNYIIPLSYDSVK